MGYRAGPPVLPLFMLVMLLFSQGLESGQLFGFVYARSTVVNEAGNYTWGEYNPATGAYIRDIGEASGDRNPEEWRVNVGR